MLVTEIQGYKENLGLRKGEYMYVGFYLVWEARKDFLSKGCLRFDCRTGVAEAGRGQRLCGSRE